MSLAPGARLGPYEILTAIGAGGMGEVYRARDSRLGREVAIKILPDALAGDPQFRERFEREARTISQLTHPHICTLYDIGTHAETTFLVMEFLQGETLEARLSKGALPLDQALKFAIEIADALNAAHRCGIVHRDLKPGNVVITSIGAKLVDFGLAKRTQPIVSGTPDSMLPTSPPALTVQGAILGTFQYMAPEQLEGAEADVRTDVFAFGCVLYEMLTSRKTFEGKTQASLIANILGRDPVPLATFQPLIPPLVDSIVRKCLAKNVDDRWQSVADLATALQWAAGGMTSSGAHTTTATEKSRWHRARLVTAFAAVALVAVVGGALGWRYLANGPNLMTTTRTEILPPPDVLWTPAPVTSAAQIAISPDGRRLAFVAARRGQISQLWIRPLDRLEAQPLPGTEGASFPFWSPDSRSLGFFALGKLKTIDTAGGGPQVLADAAIGRGGSWGRDGTILFAPTPNTGIFAVSASGGALTTVTKAVGVFGHSWPYFLPDGRHFLLYQRAPSVEQQGVYVGSLGSSAVTRVLQAASMAIYASGRILFARDRTLFAQPFDEKTLQINGEPVRVADDVGYFTPAIGSFAATASQGAVLVFGPRVALTTSLRLLDRGGTSAGLPTAPAIYSSPRLSPDQNSILVSIADPVTPNRDIWVMDLARATTSYRATLDPSADWFPIWDQTGARMFFGSARPGVTSIFQKAGTRPEELLHSSLDAGIAVASYPNDTSTDGRYLLYTQNSARGYDLGVLELSGERKAFLFHSTPFNEVQGRFSPNNRWIAYASDESGAFEIYVRRFPAADEQWKVSIGGGTQPEWRRDGKELFYISADGKLVAVPSTIDGSKPFFGTTQPLFSVEVPEVSPPYPTEYTASANGQRFLVNTVIQQPSRPSLTAVLNWTSELDGEPRDR